MAQWKQYSGTWPLQQQMQAVAAGTWTGVTQYSLYTWGGNTSGQLAQNDRVNRSSPVIVGSVGDWGLVNTSNGYSRFLIKSNGTLWSVGNNSNGTLGVNDTIDRSSPVQVGALTTWLKISAGYFNGSVLAIKTDGTLWSWGQNNNGQLGQNDTTFRSSPVQIGSGTTWSQVCALETATYAIKTDGTLWSWGGGASGRLGQNSTIAISSPTQVGALTDWSLLPAGGYNGANAIHVIKNNGTLWAWGSNGQGQLGQNNLTDRSSPVQIGALTNWSKIETGQLFALSVKTDGTLWSWGYNNAGSLGLNDRVNRSSPVQVGSLTNWSKIATGGTACGSIKTDGTLWMWGTNSTGNLGLGDIVYRSSPVQVGSNTNWEALVGGDTRSFGAVAKTTT